MADICDEAARENEYRLTDSIAAVRRNLSARGASNIHCDHCGFEIPIERQKAEPGCRLCLSCQIEEENGRPYYPR